MIIKYILKDSNQFCFNEYDINPDLINEFGIINRQSWKKNGTFKKWIKSGFVKMEDNTLFNNVPLLIINELKEVLIEKYITIKNPIEQAKQTKKGWKLYKSTDFIYKKYRN